MNQIDTNTIQKIKNLLDQLEIKKQNLQAEISKLQAQIEMHESQLKEIEEELKQQGITDLSEIDKIIQEKQNEIQTWINETENFLNS